MVQYYIRSTLRSSHKIVLCTYLHKGAAEFLYRKMTVATYLGGGGAPFSSSFPPLAILYFFHIFLGEIGSFIFSISCLGTGGWYERISTSNRTIRR